MKPKTIALTAFFLLTLVSSVLDEHFKSERSMQTGFFFGTVLISTALVFLWVYYDSAERSFPRSALLNIGVVALAMVFVPVYLVKSRPKGARLKALGWFGLVLLSYLAVSLAGEYCAKVTRI